MGMMAKAKGVKPETAADEAAEPPAEEAAESPEQEQAEHPEPEGDEGTEPTAPSDDDGDEESGGEDMPPALQPEYKRCVAALYEVMYNNDATSRNVLDSLDHTSDQGKVESVARTTMLLVHLLDKKLNISGDVFPYVLLTIVDRLIELLERVHKVKFSDKDVMATVAAAFEGAKQLVPNEENGAAAAPGADADSGPDSGAVDTGNGAAPGSVPPGASGPAPEPAEAPEASPTEEEVAQ